MQLLWTDLETTGLDPNTDVILEIAVSTADLMDPFNVKPLYHAVLNYDYSPDHGLDPHVVEMHRKSGLFGACRASTTEIEDVLEALDKLILPPRDDTPHDPPVLAGASVHFDHSFLTSHMPMLSERVSHRHYDVSAVKLFCMSLGMPKMGKAEAHRAQADVLESIEHAKACAAWLRGWR